MFSFVVDQFLSHWFYLPVLLTTQNEMLYLLYNLLNILARQ